MMDSVYTICDSYCYQVEWTSTSSAKISCVAMGSDGLFYKPITLTVYKTTIKVLVNGFRYEYREVYVISESVTLSYIPKVFRNNAKAYYYMSLAIGIQVGLWENVNVTVKF